MIERQAVFCIAADSAYPLTRTVLKPFGSTPTQAHEDFNAAQARLRNDCTERLFGHLKSRFRILSKGIDARLETAQMIICGCLVLNNMAQMFGDPEFEDESGGALVDDDGVDDLPAEVPDLSEAGSREAGVAHREKLLRYFQA